jgi:hypothetical protein
MLLKTIQKGYSTKNKNYIFKAFEIDDETVEYKIVSPDQVLVGTDRGIILLDLTYSVDNIKYNDINLFVENLIKSEK